MTRHHALVLLLLATTPGRTATPDAHDAWYVTLVGGHRAGYVHDTRSELTEHGQPLIKSTTESHFTLKRLGTELEITQTVSFWETPAGQARRFESISHFSSEDMVTRGERVKDGFAITTGALGTDAVKTIPWSDDILFPAAIDRLVAASATKPGATLKLKTFTPDLNQVTIVSMTVKGYETVAVGPGDKERLLRVDSEQDVMAGVVTSEWRDEAGEVRRMSVPIMGLTIESYRASRDAALLEPESAEILVGTLVDPGAALPRARQLEEVRFRVSTRDGHTASFPEDSRQKVSRLEDGAALLTVRAETWSTAARDPAPDASYRRTTPALQWDDPLVKKLAAEAIQGSESDADKAKAITRYVYKKIRKKGLNVGLATAKEVARTLSGDCTEHAVLAAALGRAAGIPTKVDMGLVYFQGVLGYHMWTEFYVAGAWRALDAAFGLEAADATHIKLGESSLSEGFLDQGMVQLVGLISQLQIKAVDYTLDGKRHLAQADEATLADDRYSSPLYGITLDRPQGWSFDGTRDSDPLALVRLKGPEGAEASLHAASVGYDFSLSGYVSARTIDRVGDAQAVKIDGRSGLVTKLKDGSSFVAFSDNDTVYTLRVSPPRGAAAAPIEPFLAAIHLKTRS